MSYTLSVEDSLHGHVCGVTDVIWILATGFWSDAFLWVDSDKWNDYPVHIPQLRLVFHSTIQPGRLPVPVRCKGNLYVNGLEEMHVIAGDESEVVYTICDQDGTLVDLSLWDCTVSIFEYGRPDNLLFSLPTKVYEYPYYGTFSITLPTGFSNFSTGTYLQQIVLTDNKGKTHIPSQGKIIVYKRVLD